MYGFAVLRINLTREKETNMNLVFVHGTGVGELIEERSGLMLVQFPGKAAWVDPKFEKVQPCVLPIGGFHDQPVLHL